MKAATRKHPFTPSLPPVPPSPPPPTPPPPREELENIYVDALFKACISEQHARRDAARCITSNLGFIYHRPRRRYFHDAGRHSRDFHITVLPPQAVSSPLLISRDEYLGMLDYYRATYSTETTEKEIAPILPSLISSGSDAGNITVKPLELSLLGCEDLSMQVSECSGLPAVAKLAKILERDDCTHEEAFEAYSALPFPGVSYLSAGTRQLLFRRLSVIEKKNKLSMLRYLSVIDDMKSIDLPMTSDIWNSAIAFCGQCFARITAEDVENALRTWKEMEEEADVRGGVVTFNILFDIAAKAGKFVLAEMILKEMESRNLSINRYALVSFIYYHGLKGDGDGVRRAYREFVEAGQIVDTVVLNCVIASLIRAGELPAAEQVYERMKRMLLKYTGQYVPSLNWKEVRDVGRLLNRAARQFRDQPAKIQQLRSEQSLAPNLQTYAIFVEHHASQTGELRRIASLLAEMQHLGVPMHGRIFLKLFKGFAYHGGKRYTSWTKTRLESVWSSLVDVLDQGLDDVRVMKWMVIWTVRAFERCAGRDRTLQIWAELRRRWRPGSGEAESVIDILSDILKVNNGNDNG